MLVTGTYLYENKEFKLQNKFLKKIYKISKFILDSLQLAKIFELWLDIFQSI